MLNEFNLMGRFVRDPELRYTADHTAVALFTLAVERDYKSADGSRATDFIDCQAWRKTAEHIEKYFKKGRLCVVNGRLQTRVYTDNNDIRRKVAEVIINNIYFADRKEDSGQAPTAGDRDFYEVAADDSDLPF